MTKEINKINPSQLIDRIGSIITEARQRTVQTVNTILVKTYWEIGREIVECEIGGKSRAEYGEELVKNLANELTDRYGKGFSYRNLQRMKQFYLAYSIVPTVSAQSSENDATLSHKSGTDKIRSTASIKSEAKEIFSTSSGKSVLSEKMLSKLSWLHICLLLTVSDKDARSFYEIENNLIYIHSILDGRRNIQEILSERLLR